MDSKFTFYFPSSVGHLKLEFQDRKLSSLFIVESPLLNVKDVIVREKSKDKVVQKTLSSLNHYFDSVISFLALPLAPVGTTFQRSVWHELSTIPLGETRTYGEIAKKLNSSPRAVGNACRKNPIQIIIPCHRVISAKGIGGYAGETDGQQLDIKRWLLRHEGVVL